MLVRLQEEGNQSGLRMEMFDFVRMLTVSQRRYCSHHILPIDNNGRENDRYKRLAVQIRRQ